MEKLSAGKPAPDFTLAGTNGEKFSLRSAQAKGPTVIAFFKVSCPVCHLTFPFLERLHNAYGDSQATFWGISQDNALDTQEFCREFGIRFPTLIDAKGYPVSSSYGLTNVPTIFLIAPDGKIEISSAGFSRADLEAISAALARQLARPAFAVFTPDDSVPDYKPG